MSTSHTVDLLDAGLVIKMARTWASSEKLLGEARQIRRLCCAHPKQMVAVLHEGMIHGRAFYAMDKMPGTSLSDLIFDGHAGLDQQRQALCLALEEIACAIEREQSLAAPVELDLHALLHEEWALLEPLHGLLNRYPRFNGQRLPVCVADLYVQACRLATRERFQAVQVAHLNFHFGNVLYDASSASIHFIDPDVSLKGLDPLFGLARFGFSFWHEMATQGRGRLIADSSGKQTDYRLADARHQHLLDSLPCLRSIDGLLPWVDAHQRNRLRALTLYCFLRSIRLNAREQARDDTHHASPQEVLALGSLLYLGASCA